MGDSNNAAEAELALNRVDDSSQIALDDAFDRDIDVAEMINVDSPSGAAAMGGTARMPRAPAGPDRPAASRAQKRRKTPSVLLQRDVFARHGASLALAEKADESLDRMLLVVRFLLQLCADVARPHPSVDHLPLATMGTHYVGQRQLGPHGAGTVLLHIQEMAFYDGEEVEPYCRRPEGSLRAFMDINARPQAKVKGGRLRRSVAIRVQLRARCKVTMPSHAETYVFELPDVLIMDPMGTAASAIELQGDVKISAPANGLSCTMQFRPGARVDGFVERLNGLATERVCTLSGAWDGEVHASSAVLGATGLVFTAVAPGQPPVQRSVDLRRFGPRQLPRLWTAIHDALYSMEPGDASAGALPQQALREVRAELSDLTIRSQLAGGAPGLLAAQGAAEAGKPAGAGRDVDGDSDSDDSDDEGLPPRSVVQMPPCIWAMKKQGRAMWWRLQYRLLVVPGSVTQGPLPMVTCSEH
ncbi:unnamed protein product [Pedinophyceae sp. YPF-701]|nr:unnamed protein product [Pedinophyceae sp. YPF-701]